MPLIGADDTYVVTGRPLQETIRSAGLPLQDEHIIAEPAKRNTAGALVFAAAHLLAERGEGALDTTVAVLPADHLIDPGDAFRYDISQAMTAVEERGGLAVVGIPPTRPETGYGYIERADTEVEAGGFAHPVAAFREKPDAETASAYLASGRHYWNSGMFFWRLRDFLDQLQKATPGHHRVVGPLSAALRDGDEQEAQRLFETLPDISIDYALMERAEQVWMVAASFNWDDLGAWDALARTWAADEDGNITRGESVVLGSRECIVLNEAEDTSVAVVGVEGLTVVVTDDGVLVTRTDDAQQVRDAVDELKQRKSPHL
jgi:mannose-1-phosphate guanylyltransferase